MSTGAATGGPLAAWILDALPQTQCTRCGYPDCAGYADAIAQGQAGINQCPPGGAEGVVRLSALTGKPIQALNPEFGNETPRTVVFIDEAWCIGCTLCIKACPTDAIVGSHKLMHTVIEPNCTGCELCLPACPVDCIDIVASRGCERIFDLNYPQDMGLHDLVLDCGTVEHCFNIGQAIINAANAVEEGGVIFHTPPISMINHGFYNLSPTVLYDFYTQNGWGIEFMAGVQGKTLFPLDPIGRQSVPSECSMYMVARRTNMNPMVFPTQSKYLANPDLKVLH